MIRNDTSRDFTGPESGVSGSLENFLAGMNGMVTPVFDSQGNLTGYKSGFPGASTATSASPAAGGVAVPTSNGLDMATLPATQTVPYAGTMPAGLTSSLAGSSGMDPMTAWLLFGSIASSAIGSGLQASAASNAQQLSAQQFEEQRKDSRQNQLAQFLQGIIGLNQQKQLTQAGQGLAATQMDPYAQAKDLNAANIRRSFAEGLGPGGKFNGSFDVSAIQPDYLRQTGDMFYKNQAAAQPNVPLGAQSPDAEQFRQTLGASQKTEQQALIDRILDFLNGIGQGGYGASTPLKGNDNTRGNG